MSRSGLGRIGLDDDVGDIEVFQPGDQPIHDPVVTADHNMALDVFAELSRGPRADLRLQPRRIEEANEGKGISMLNIILYILGAIAVIAAGIYFFMRRETTHSAADVAREQTSSEPTPEPQQEESVQEESYSEPEPDQPTQEETQTESREEEKTSENKNEQSSNSDDENNNK